MEEQIKYLRALLYVTVYQADEEKLGVKKEVLLVSAGLSYKETAEMLNKTEAAVQKAVSRSRPARTKGATK